METISKTAAMGVIAALIMTMPGLQSYQAIAQTQSCGSPIAGNSVGGALGVAAAGIPLIQTTIFSPSNTLGPMRLLDATGVGIRAPNPFIGSKAATSAIRNGMPRTTPGDVMPTRLFQGNLASGQNVFTTHDTEISAGDAAGLSIQNISRGFSGLTRAVEDDPITALGAENRIYDNALTLGRSESSVIIGGSKSDPGDSELLRSNALSAEGGPQEKPAVERIVSKKLAFFDFDGTLSAGFISMRFLDYLNEKGLYDPGEYARQMHLVKRYKDGAISYDAWVEQWGLAWAKGLEGKSAEAVTQSAKDFFEGFKHNIYPQSLELTRYLKKEGYHRVLISAGVWETAELAREYLEMDDVIATRVGIENGLYTGQLLTRVHTQAGKGEAIDNYVKERGVRKPVFAFGDSTGDISMLERAVFPVPLNPDKGLSKFSRTKSWPENIGPYNVVSYVQTLIKKGLFSYLHRYAAPSRNGIKKLIGLIGTREVSQPGLLTMLLATMILFLIPMRGDPAFHEFGHYLAARLRGWSVGYVCMYVPGGFGKAYTGGFSGQLSLSYYNELWNIVVCLMGPLFSWIYSAVILAGIITAFPGVVVCPYLTLLLVFGLMGALGGGGGDYAGALQCWRNWRQLKKMLNDIIRSDWYAKMKAQSK